MEKNELFFVQIFTSFHIYMKVTVYIFVWMVPMVAIEEKEKYCNQTPIIIRHDENMNQFPNNKLYGTLIHFETLQYICISSLICRIFFFFALLCQYSHQYTI